MLMGRGAPVVWCVTNALCTFRRLCGRPELDKGMRAFNSGAGENVVQWCLLAAALGRNRL
jgi:hypothetical protein